MADPSPGASTPAPLPSPVLETAFAPAAPEAGVALCLSGGGYRAMLFHLGSLWRLQQAGLLEAGAVRRVSSVSGGSITAAVLALAWGDKGFPAAEEDRFSAAVVGPVRGLARHTIDVGSVLNPFHHTATNVAAAYRRDLFGDKTLQDLPDQPRFVLNATNVQTGVLWRFSKPYMGDYRVGLVMNPTLDVAAAVGASSAFPPFLSPTRLALRHEDFTPDPKADLQQPPYTTNVVLSDGGVYDNLGLETAFKRYDTLLVGDGGAKTAPEPEPHGDWPRLSYRVLDLIDNQVRSLRKRVLVGAYRDGSRRGTYWGIRTDVADYQLADPLPCPHATTLELAAVPTRLEATDDALQERLINWGYAVCDAALRKHYDPGLPKGRFPYPNGV